MNSFGTRFRISIFGESHGEAVGIVVDGVPAGTALAVADFEADIDRRRGGRAGTTPRKEDDRPHIVSGVCNGVSTGAPITLLFDNVERRSEDYDEFRARPRPSHSDLTARIKHKGFNDHRGGGHFSGRLTLPLVAAGVLAKKMLPGLGFSTRIVAVGGCEDESCFGEIINVALADGDSVGGVVECRISGAAAGSGEPFFDSVESVASHLLFSIPAVKGVEFGSGFRSAAMRGSENNDMITDIRGRTATNNDGGINGGITNGNEMVVRVAVKPTASIARPQKSINLESGLIEEFSIRGRHDACIALRAAVAVEAAMAVAMAQFIPAPAAG